MKAASAVFWAAMVAVVMAVLNEASESPAKQWSNHAKTSCTAARCTRYTGRCRPIANIRTMYRYHLYVIYRYILCHNIVYTHRENSWQYNGLESFMCRP